MNKYFPMLVLSLSLASCSNNKKNPKAINTTAIHKIWEFKKIDTGTASGNLGNVRIAKNLLDLTNKDTLCFSYKNTKNAPTRYPYKILHDTIFVQNGVTYKILKLTDTELDLANSFKNNNSKDSTTIVMVYGAK